MFHLHLFCCSCINGDGFTFDAVSKALSWYRDTDVIILTLLWDLIVIKIKYFLRTPQFNLPPCTSPLKIVFPQCSKIRKAPLSTKNGFVVRGVGPELAMLASVRQQFHERQKFLPAVYRNLIFFRRKSAKTVKKSRFRKANIPSRVQNWLLSCAKRSTKSSQSFQI